ncbi:hypothetical protein FBBAL38_09857 [Flavobacteria bacterium BAL38]|uniref:YHYH protein n=2 Tax=unclassified Flavobacterium TaxID=196869 RepID=UPI0000F3897C|nr:YHYH protein [Flavobacterium sp. LMO6]EAZ94734.1 hypothetical protein FBBAL38_09857 [Flavobacteria bacterium BAL38]MQP62933.1 YHYH protein [Flavobacterium sp. LMO6]
MKKTFTFLALLTSFIISAQLNPAITNWLVNTTNITGRHYVSGNSTPITDAVLANVQTVQYNTNYVYVTATGIPAYITGPFLDGNPSLATAQNKIFRITLTPTQNTGTLTATTGGNIGIFKNGVALFDYRDGVSYKNSTGAEAGGPIGGTGDGVWNRDAIVAERGGFDCSKAHPAQGNYHHHQNPSAFNLDLQVLSTICDTYPSDGLYVINPSQHSPLLGYAYDGFPIYGAYAYANTDGTGGIVRMKSSYQLRNITARTHYADGTDVTDGPPVNTTYPLGRYREDYEFVTNSSPDYLDKHNGRFCITPEYPSGIYCYFTTVDANHNSAYPYAVGPYFYGVKNTTTGGTVTSIPGGTTTLSSDSFENNNFDITIAPNPASEFIAIQSKMTESDLDVELISELGQVIKKSKILQGSTLSIIETDSVYNGIYFVKISSKNNSKTYKVIIKK